MLEPEHEKGSGDAEAGSQGEAFSLLTYRQESRAQKSSRQAQAWEDLKQNGTLQICSATVSLSDGGQKLTVQIGIPEDGIVDRKSLNELVNPLPGEIREFAVEPFAEEVIPWSALGASDATTSKLSGLIHCAWQEMVANQIEHDLLNYHENEARREMVDLAQRINNLREEGATMERTVELEFLPDSENIEDSIVRMTVHNQQPFEDFENLKSKLLSGDTLTALDVAGGMGLMIALGTYPNARQEVVVGEDGSLAYHLIFEATLREMVTVCEARAA